MHHKINIKDLKIGDCIIFCNADYYKNNMKGMFPDSALRYVIIKIYYRSNGEPYRFKLISNKEDVDKFCTNKKRYNSFGRHLSRIDDPFKVFSNAIKRDWEYSQQEFRKNRIEEILEN